MPETDAIDLKIIASMTRLADVMEHLEDVTLSDSDNRNRIADILTHVVHARDGLITGEEMLLKISKLLGVPFYDVYGRPIIDGRDPDEEEAPTKKAIAEKLAAAYPKVK